MPYQVFEVADGYIIIATGNDNQFIKLCGVLGAKEISGNPAYKDNVGRLSHRDTIIGELTAYTKKFKRDDLLAKLEAVQVPAGPINDVEQVFNDPQVVARGIIAEFDQPSVGRVRQPKPAARFEINEAVIGGPAPRSFHCWMSDGRNGFGGPLSHRTGEHVLVR